MDDPRFQDELRRFWDEVARGEPANAGELDPADAETIRLLHALGDAPPPDPDYSRRLKARLLDTAPGAPARQPLPVWSPNGRAAVPGLPGARRHAVPHARPAWALWGAVAAFALVAAVVIALIVRVQTDRTAFVPGVATPLPIEATPRDWPLSRGNPARTGAISEPGPQGQPKELWRFSTSGLATRSPAVASGMAYQLSADGVLQAIDAATGVERWRYDHGNTGPNTPTVADGMVYVTNLAGELIALDAATGAVRWRFAEAVSVESTPAVVDGVLFVGGSDDAVFALDTTTGAERWRAAVNGQVARSVAVADGRVYAGTQNGRLYALDAETGAERWQFFAGNGNEAFSAPTAANGSVYAAQGEVLYALGAGDGTAIWQKPFPGAQSFAAAGDLLFFAAPDWNVYALDATTGDPRWTFDTVGDIRTAPVIAADTLYVASTEHILFALNVTTGAEQWQFPVDGDVDAGPSIADGVLYVSTGAGSLTAIGGSGVAQLLAPDAAAAKDAPAEATPETSATPIANGPAPLTATFQWRIDSPPGDEFAYSPNMATAPDGTLWVVDGGNMGFQLVSPDGEPGDHWGQPGDGPGEFNFLREADSAFGQVAFAADGGFYVADSQNFRIQQFDRNRRFVRSWGKQGDGDGQFKDPLNVLVDRTGAVYVIDDYRDDVQKFTADGRFILKFGGHGNNDGQFDFIGGGALAPDSTVWVTDYLNVRMQQFAPDGTFIQIAADASSGAGVVNEPQMVAVDQQGRIFVADGGSGRVLVYGPEGQFLMALDGTEGGGTKFSYPSGIAIDNEGGLYVLDRTSRGSYLQKYRLTPNLTATPVS